MSGALEEHIGYLSDAVRLDRFVRAVSRVIGEGDTVADVGCGFGILGLICLNAGASHVWGIDRTEAIEIARETMRRAGLEDRYTCVHAVSRQVTLPERVDVVICDHVGYFGFDYGIIGTLGDARRRFLKPGGKILPSRIVLQVAGIESAGCRALADAWRSEPVPAEYRWLREHGVNTKHPYTFDPAELATSSADLGTFDLREDSPEYFSFEVSLEARRDGALDGLAGWFACEIADDVWMTNSPVAEARIKRSQAFLPFATPLVVVAGDVLEVSVSMRPDDTIISWSARVARTGQRVRQSTWASKILDPQDRVPPTERIPRLNRTGAARRTLLALIDGQATEAEIERAMLRDHAGLFPTPEQIALFVRSELYRSTH